MSLAENKDWKSIEEGKEISLRGFLYRSDDGNWILSQEPNLRSCCVGSAKKINSQVVLEGDINEVYLQKAVTIKGIWSKEPRFQLNYARIEETNQWSLLWIIPIILIGGYLVRKMQRVRQ